jgi:polyhydroxybutyrate depolymerase
MTQHASLRHLPALLALLGFSSLVQAAVPAPATRPASSPTTQPTPLSAGNYRRELTVDGRKRSYLIHVPPSYDPSKPTPIVLAFHGAWMSGPQMVLFSGLNAKSDQSGFVVVYPNGLGFGEAMGFFNAFYKPAPPAQEGPPDDVSFTAHLLDDLATALNVDAKRTFATGMSNGGMMCHRLAAELPDRIAAIAPVAGTIATADFKPKQPVPVLHIHGTDDPLVPFDGPERSRLGIVPFRSVDATIKAWVEADGCPAEPKITELPDANKDGMIVTKKVYGPGKNDTEVILIEVKDGGHTWPGRPSPLKRLGKTTNNISANDVIWEFFQRHPMK